MSKLEMERALVDVLRGTVVENDEDELARLRKLALHKQIEVGFVLRAAMFEDKTSKLKEVRCVDDALRYLHPNGTLART